MNDNEILECPKCGSENVKKIGFDWSGERQRIGCKRCFRTSYLKNETLQQIAMKVSDSYENPEN